MRKGTFSVENAKTHSSKHNSRELLPKYLIDNSKENYYELIISDDKFIAQAQKRYKEIVKQNMQKKQIPALIKETVLTIHEHQNENDIKSLFKKLNEEFGGHHLTELSIHRDEGYFFKDDIAYYPTKNILNKNGNWYICSNTDITKPKKEDFDTKVNINDFEKVFNYHAHAKFSMFDMNTGKTARMHKSQMSKRIKLVSDYLGLDYNPSVDRFVKKSVNQIKDEHLAIAREKEKTQQLHKQKKEQEELKLSNTQSSFNSTNLNNFNINNTFNKKLFSNMIWTTTRHIKKTINTPSNISFLENKNIEQQAKIKDLKEVVKALREELKNKGLKREDFKEVEDKNRELHKLIKNKDLSLSDLKNEIQTLKDKLQKKEENESNLQAYNTNLNKDIEALQETNEDLRDNINKLVQENENYENIVKELKEELKTAQEKSKAYYGLNESLKLQVNTLKMKINSFERQQTRRVKNESYFNDEHLEPIPDTSHLKKKLKSKKY